MDFFGPKKVQQVMKTNLQIDDSKLTPEIPAFLETLDDIEYKPTKRGASLLFRHVLGCLGTYADIVMVFAKSLGCYTQWLFVNVVLSL